MDGWIPKGLLKLWLEGHNTLTVALQAIFAKVGQHTSVVKEKEKVKRKD